MKTSNLIAVDVQSYLINCPPHDESIDDSLIELIAKAVLDRFDYSAICDQIDDIACEVIREQSN